MTSDHSSNPGPEASSVRLSAAEKSWETGFTRLLKFKQE
jgi:hypothetical protein